MGAEIATTLPLELTETLPDPSPADSPSISDPFLVVPEEVDETVEGSRLAVGSTILGGMIISTFFTLYVTPTMYLALAKNTKRIDAVDLDLKKELSKK